MTNKNSLFTCRLKYIAVAVLAALLGAAHPASAQIAELPAFKAPLSSESPASATETSAATVAMIYHRLAAKTPDFSLWAKDTEAYKNASPLEKDFTLEKEVAEIKGMFTLTTLSEPIVIQQDITLSPYSYKNNGFTIDEFNEDAYFPFSYGGQNFAVVIPTLPNYQWIDADGDAAGIMEQTAEKNGRRMVATLYITPEFADAKNTMSLDGKDYWLVSGQVKRLVISAPNSTKTLWEKSSLTAADGAPHQDILDLYRK